MDKKTNNENVATSIADEQVKSTANAQAADALTQVATSAPQNKQAHAKTRKSAASTASAPAPTQAATAPARKHTAPARKHTALIAAAAIAILAGITAFAIAANTNVKYDKYAPVVIQQEIPEAQVSDTWITLQFTDTSSNSTYRQPVKIAAGEKTGKATVMLEVYKNYEISFISDQSGWRFENETATYNNSTADGGNDSWSAASTTKDGAATTKLKASLKLGTVDKPVKERKITLTNTCEDDPWVDANTSVVNTITIPDQKVVSFDNQGHGNEVATQYVFVDGESTIAEPTTDQVGTEEGLTFEGWYTDAKCTEANKFDTDDFAAAVTDKTPLTLYANWIPATDGDALKYWIAPAYRMTTGNTAVGTDVNVENTANYVKEEWNVKKSYAEIQEDLAVLSDTAHENFTTDKYNEVFAEYESFMKNDNYHLYCKYNGATTTNKDDYIEFRILQVGAHTANGESDGTALTFEATNVLPLAYQPNKTNDNKGGWAASMLYEEMQAGGEIYNLFPEALQNDAMNIMKYSTSGGGSGETPATELTGSALSKFWVTSISEIRGYTDYGYGNEGDQYAYYKNIGVTADYDADARYLTSLTSFWLRGFTRNIQTPVNANISGNYNGFFILRSPRTTTSDDWEWQNGGNNASSLKTAITASYSTCTAKNGVAPCFSLGGVTGKRVTFDIQGHGTQVADQYVESGGKATDPTADAGTFDGLTLEGWYNNPACKTSGSTNGVANKKWTFGTDTVTSAITLYANWVPTTEEITNNYWLAPAYLCTTGNTAIGTDVDVENTANYENPETNIKKTAAEIQADVKLMQSGNAKVIAEYKEYMTKDNYHLYCKYNGSTAKGTDDYLEFRIIQVGAHTANGASDGTMLTFQAVRALPTSYAPMAATSNVGGWPASLLYTALNAATGDLYTKFPIGLRTDAASITKYSTEGNTSTTLVSAASKFWPISVTELSGYTGAGYASEGDQYAYYKDVVKIAVTGATAKTLTPSQIAVGKAHKTRSGVNPSNGSQQYWEFFSLRSPAITNATGWSWVQGTNGTIYHAHTSATNYDSVLPCFAFSGNYAVGFNMNGHGLENSVQNQYVAYGNTASEPSVADSKGLTLEGWYNNPNCLTTGNTGTTANKKWDFETDTITANTVLYANWVPTDDELNKYWIAPAYRVTTGNTDATAFQENGAYVSEITNVKKSSEEIQEDVLILEKGNTTDNPRYATVLAQYTNFMNNDNYHLYTKIGDGTTLNDYAEFRIIQVGEHTANGEGDSSVLTFQATHAMPNAYQMNATNIATGWANCAIRTTMNTDGFEGLKTGLTNDIMSVVKKSRTGGKADGMNVIVDTTDKLWLLSASEYLPNIETAKGWGGTNLGNTLGGYNLDKEGNAYTFWSNKTLDNGSTTTGENVRNYSIAKMLGKRDGTSSTGQRAANDYAAWERSACPQTTCTSQDFLYLWPNSKYIGFVGTDNNQSPTQKQGILPAFCFGGYLLQFDTLGGSDVDAQLLKSQTKATKPDTNPTRDGYVFKGWYTKDGSSTNDWGDEFDFDNTTVTADTTIYAKWENVSDSYWLNYANAENPEENVLKTKTDIQQDLAILQEGATNADYARVFAEYSEYMNGSSDSLTSEVHLYTKLADGVNTTGDTKNDYAEWRIISLGEHDADGTTITWQMTHVLPTAQQMNGADTNAGGYATSALHTSIAENTTAGSVYTMFKTAFLSDILKVGKTSGTGNKGSDIADTADKLWLVSAEEVFGESAVNVGAVKTEDATQYEYFEHRGVTKSDSTNECIAYRTRAGGIPTGQDTDYSEYHGGDAGSEEYVSWWLRSPSAYNNQTYTRIYNDGRLDHNLATVKRGVALTCAMGQASVKFKTLEHGTKTQFSRAISEGSVISVPTTADYGKSTGLTMAGWYNNLACYGDAANLTGGTLEGGEVFYANWTPTADSSAGNLSYWISPSYKYIKSGQNVGLSGNSASATAQARDNYVKEEWNVLKSSTEIQEDLKKIQAGNAATIAEYKQLMQDDKFHLYTKVSNGTGTNDYMECRIVEVGDHDNGNGSTDATTLTFQAIHALPNAYVYNTSVTTVGGWNASALRTYMNSGSIYNLFKDAFKDAVTPVSKLTSIGEQRPDIVTSNDKFWLMSSLEISGNICYGNAGEGTEYDFWQARNIGTGSNSSLIGLTKSRADGNVGSDCGYLRSPSRNTNGKIARIYRNNGSINYYDTPATPAEAVTPCFSFGPAKVTFDTQEHGVATTFLEVIDNAGHVAEPTVSQYGESTGLTLEGWYTNKACAGDKIDFATDTFDGTETLYANWVPTANDEDGNLSYWIGPSMTYVASGQNVAAADNSASVMSNARDSYVKEEWNVLKSSTEIQEDMVKIAAGDASTIAEYKALMNNDKYHLYTRWNGDTATYGDVADTTGKNSYVESRIIQVGAHDTDGSALTFMATHTLPTAYALNTATSNVGGWPAMSLRTEMQEGGTIYANFNTQFTSALATITKKNHTGGTSAQDADPTTSQDALWLASYSEIVGASTTGYDNRAPKLEGSQYAWFAGRTIATSANNSALVFATRSGQVPASSTTEQIFWWERSPLLNVADVYMSKYFLFGGAGGSLTSVYGGPTNKQGVAPCFSLAAPTQVTVTFNTQEHGNATYTKKALSTVELGTKASEYGQSEGLTLEGWYDNAACYGDKILEPNGTKIFTEDTTLYANWVPIVNDENGNLSYWIGPSAKYIETVTTADALSEALTASALGSAAGGAESENALGSAAGALSGVGALGSAVNTGALGAGGADATSADAAEAADTTTNDASSANLSDISIANTLAASTTSTIVDNAASASAKARSNYVKEEWNVLKSSKEIQADLVKIQAGDEATIAEYTELMSSDKFHLYTAYNGSTTDSSGSAQEANAYLESRIIEVGTHYNDAEDETTADGSVLTFQATHILPTAYAMGPRYNSYGWHESPLKANMSEGGTIFESFNDGFTDSLASVTKRGLNGSGSTDLTDSESEMWVPSAMEQSGGYYAEGTEYQFFKDRATVYGGASNVALAKTTRAGNDASGNYREYGYWLRSSRNGQAYPGQMACVWGGQMSRDLMYNSYRPMGIAPMFALAPIEPVEVTFDTQLHGNDTYTKETVAARVTTNADEYGTSTGLVLEGWYDNAACAGTKVMEANGTKKFTKETTLYANWVPENGTEDGNLSYWIGPSMTYVAEGQNVAAADNSASVMNNARDSYVSEEWNVLKSSAEIQADLAKMKQELKNGTFGQYGTASRQYQEIMNSDKYHLYTKWNGTQANYGEAETVKNALNAYVESRIIEVGNHDSSELLTFQTVHSLAKSYTVTTAADQNYVNWQNSTVRTAMLENGEIFESFNDAFTKSLASVTKTTTVGGGSTNVVQTQDKLWTPAMAEILGDLGSPWSTFTVEGSQYAWYKARSITRGNNACLAIGSNRAGNVPYNQENNNAFMYSRSPNLVFITTTPSSIYNYSGLMTQGSPATNFADGTKAWSRIMCFALGAPVEVTFDTQDHGNATYTKSAASGNVSTSASEYGTSAGLTLEGWYDNAACAGDKVMEADGTVILTQDTTLYANWIPTKDSETGNLSYWIGPSMTYVAEGQNVAAADNSAASMNNARDSYVSEEWNVLKSSTEIKQDLAKIKQGDAKTIAEYTEIMNSDKYHLYTAYKGADATVAKNKYLEARIIQVGNHQASATAGDNDDAGLTFAATHLLPTAYTMNSGVTATGGWEASQLRATMNDATTGFLSTNYFNTAFTDNLQATKKVSDIGSQSSNTATTYDKFWVLSYNEMTTSDRIAATYVVPDNDGVVYDWFKARNTTGNGVNPSFAMLTRAGAEPASQLRVQTWFRTAGLANNQGFLFWGHSNYGSQAAGITPGATNAFYANDHSAIELCFTMASEYNLDKTKFQTALQALDTKPEVVKFVTGNDAAIASLEPVSDAGVQVDDSGVNGNKIGLYQSADKATIYVAPMNKTDDVIYAPEDSSFLMCGTATYTGLSDSLKTATFDNLDTSKVTDMEGMFYNCSALTSLDVSGFDTSKVTTMKNMFYNCQVLASLDVSKFNTANVTNMQYMFGFCKKLTSLNLSSFNTAKVTDMSRMFMYCNALTSIDVSSFNTSNVTDMTSMFSNCTTATAITLSSNFNTAKVTSFGSMFESCTKVTSLDVSNFNTSAATNMNSMFKACKAITTLDLSNFNTSKVTSMYSMISDCSVLTSVDVSSFDTSSVTNMQYMFRNNLVLPTLNISNFNTSKVTNMSGMFASCYKLATLTFDTTKFSTASVTSMESMFSSCQALTTLDLSKFNTAKVASMKYMFYNCKGLTSLTLTSFDTQKVTDMFAMFTSCSSLTTLNLSSFNTTKVTNMGSMFSSCTNLATISVKSSNFVVTQVTESSSMFSDCTSLKGGSNTAYAHTNANDKTYAHVDGGTANPGYFTAA